MTRGRAAWETLPEAVVAVLDEFRHGFPLDAHLWIRREEGDPFHLYPEEGGDEAPRPESILLEIPARNGSGLVLEVRGRADGTVRSAANALRTALEHLYGYSEEVRFFTYEVSERYEEINLLYSISETLGSLLPLRESARLILDEVCDVLAARRGSLWVHRGSEEDLTLVASVGEDGREGPIEAEDPNSVTARVFRDGRSLILTGEGFGEGPSGAALDDSVLSVPIRYTPPSGRPRTVGVINLIGRRRGGRFTASDQKLLAAIASQVGAALENHRLLRESVERERVTREMELAHDLQMKLLPTVGAIEPEVVAARVEPAESVGGDFYHFLRLPEGRYGVMIGDVSSHGFPASLIMALAMSAATIYAPESESPARVLGEMSGALRDELETTEMYLTLFYAVVDPGAGRVTYANAGHPHAFAVRGDGSSERLEAVDPPVGIAANDEYGERTVPWAPGRDLLLLFTDGLSETLVPGSHIAGEQRVVDEAVRLAARSPEEIVEALFGLDGDREGPGGGDDRSALVLKV